MNYSGLSNDTNEDDYEEEKENRVSSGGDAITNSSAFIDKERESALSDKVREANADVISTGAPDKGDKKDKSSSKLKVNEHMFNWIM